MKTTVRYFTPLQVTLATFFGGPLAAGYLLARNYRQFEEKQQAKMSLIIGAVAYVFILVVILLLSKSAIKDFPIFFLPIAYTAIAYTIVKGQQSTRIKAAQGRGARKGTVGSWLLATLSGMVSMVLLLFFMQQITEKKPYGGESFEYGALKHEIFCKDINRSEAEEILLNLEYVSHFEEMDHPTVILIEAKKEAVQIAFPVRKENWQNPQVIQYYATVEERLNGIQPGRKVQVVIFDEGTEELEFSDI